MSARRFSTPIVIPSSDDDRPAGLAAAPVQAPSSRRASSSASPKRRHISPISGSVMISGGVKAMRSPIARTISPCFSARSWTRVPTFCSGAHGVRGSALCPSPGGSHEAAAARPHIRPALLLHAADDRALIAVAAPAAGAGVSSDSDGGRRTHPRPAARRDRRPDTPTDRTGRPAPCRGRPARRARRSAAPARSAGCAAAA